MTLRSKFTLAAFLLTESVLLSCITTILLIEQRHLNARQLSSQQAALGRFADACRGSLAARNDFLIINTMKAIDFGPELRYALLADADGKIRVHSDLLKGERRALEGRLDAALIGRPGSGVLERESGGERIREWSKPVLIDGKLAGWALVAYSIDALESDVQRTLREMALRLLAIVLILSALWGLGAWALTWRLNRSIRDLSITAERMEGGDLNAHVRAQTKDELGSLVSSFNHIASQLKRLEEIRARMIAGISHDFKAPLAAISAYAQTLEDMAGSGLDKDGRDCIEGISSNVKRLALMAEDIVGYARIAEGRAMAPRRSSISLKDTAEEALRLLDSMIREADIRVECRISASLPSVHADPSLILRVLVNLLSNSLKFTPKSGSILISAKEAGGVAEIRFQDTGAGVPAERLAHLFEGFLEASDAPGMGREKGGTGFGLFICKEIIEAHSGTIRAESEVGKGTTIIMTLPLAGRNA
jgi:signal transduction histidine kinase